MIGVAILGSTGSIGVSTLDVVGRHPARFRVVALTANRDVEGLLLQVREYRPEYAVMADEDAAQRLDDRVRAEGLETQVLAGSGALARVASLDQVDYVMAAIVGAAGLLPALAAAESGKRVLLANKEALVVAGQQFVDAVRRGNAVLLPIDSEHNAIFQCLPDGYSADPAGAGIERILLTASGGPFRTWPMEKLAAVTPAQACDHPNWDMGRKISVDSATMMNKGLEVIEAHWLFGVGPERIQVVVHPQSVIHSMVQYADGSVLAQMGNPDMRTPIAHALAWPERIEAGVTALDLYQVAHLDFEAPDLDRFPCLALAFEALRRGGDYPAVLNAANEIAVAAFLEGRIPFTGIPRLIESALAGHSAADAAVSLDDLISIDGEVRLATEERIAGMV